MTAKKTTKKTIKKKTPATPKPPPAEPKKILWENMLWFSKGKNWRAEYRLRIQTGISNPFINPKTNCVYSIPAQNYRDPHIVIKLQNTAAGNS